jgi:GTP cyclohydrolase II
MLFGGIAWRCVAILFTARDVRPMQGIQRPGSPELSMNHTPFRASALPQALPDIMQSRMVHRAVAEIRRGVAVVIEAGDAAIVALPAETPTPETLAECLAVAVSAATPPMLLLALSRVVAGRIGATPLGGTAEIAALPLEAVSLSVESLRALADPTMLQAPKNQVRPAIGSAVPPLLAEAALQLAKLARLLPAMLVRTGVLPGAADGLLRVGAEAVLRHPADAGVFLVRAAEARVPLDDAEDARIVAFRPPDGGIEHLAILIGHPEAAEAPLTRVHSECFTGDLLGSRRCDCGPQLHQAIRRMSAEGAGVLLYMAQEGRGIGLVNKLRAYTLQDAGLDTLDANKALGFGADERSFVAAASMLKQLGMRRVRLLTNNPDKIAGLSAHGIEVVGRVSHAIAANGENDLYLETKARRFGHLLG